MATVNINPQYVTDAGADITFTTLNATDTYVVDNDGRTILYFRNTGGSDATVTFDIPRNVVGLEVTDPTATVPDTTGHTGAGTFPPAVYGSALTFDNDQASGVSVAAIRI